MHRETLRATIAGRTERRGTMQNVQTFRRAYLIGALIVWVGILVSAAITLAGTPYLAQMLPILGGGAVWFAVIIPGAMYRRG
jgi:hypothetical protein